MPARTRARSQTRSRTRSQTRSRTRTQAQTRARTQAQTRAQTRVRTDTTTSHTLHDQIPARGLTPSRLSNLRLTELQGIADSYGIAYAGMQAHQLRNALARAMQGTGH